MNVQEVGVWMGSDDGQYWIGVAKYAVSSLGGGVGLMILQWVTRFVAGQPSEVRRILDGLRDAQPKSVKVLTPLANGNTQQSTRNTLHIDGSDLHVDYTVKPEGGVELRGAVYVGENDFSNLYEQHELRTILKRAKQRREEIEAKVRRDARRMVSDSIPILKTT